MFVFFIVVFLFFLILFVFKASIIEEEVSDEKTDSEKIINTFSSEMNTEEKEQESQENVLKKIELVIQEDEFEDTTTINFNNILIKGSRYLPMYFEKIGEYVCHDNIGISFSIFQNQLFLDVSSNVDGMGLAKDDRLILLFENKDKIDITFKSARQSNGYYKYNQYLLSKSELIIFKEQKLDKWKLISSRRNIYVVGDNTMFFEDCMIKEKEFSQKILQTLALKICQVEYTLS